jgi:hypothetical protein
VTVGQARKRDSRPAVLEGDVVVPAGQAGSRIKDRLEAVLDPEMLPRERVMCPAK